MKKQKNPPTLKLWGTSKKVSFRQFIFPVVLIIIIYGLGLVFTTTYPKTNEIPYEPDDVEVVVEDASGSSQLPESENNKELDMSKELGPATVEEIIGGTSSDEFYQTPSIEKLLEGKEIEMGE